MTDEESYFGYLFTLEQEKEKNLSNYLLYCTTNSLHGKEAFEHLQEFDLTPEDISVSIYKRYLRPY